MLTVELLQTFAVAALVITGLGFTVIVTVVNEEHPPAVAVMVNTVTCCAMVVLVNVPLILTVPLAAIPVRLTVLSLVQLKVVPATAFGLDITDVAIATPEQTDWLLFVAFTVGVGFTATAAVMGAPGQPLAVGVIVNVTVIKAFVVFVNAPLISPLPLAAIPVTVAVLFLVQL
jgi:hypothetical protein